MLNIVVTEVPNCESYNLTKGQNKHNKNREIRNAYAREYYQKNRDSMIKKQKEWNEINSDKFREYQKRYYNKQKQRPME